MDQVEHDLVLEEVDPCWEDIQQEESARQQEDHASQWEDHANQQEIEMTPVYEEESEAMVEMPRWENREVLEKESVLEKVPGVQCGILKS